MLTVVVQVLRLDAARLELLLAASGYGIPTDAAVAGAGNGSPHLEGTMQSELLEYHISIARELESVQNRVRNLIGNKHWLSDGEHKEAVLRRVLRNHVPETIRVGSSFVYFEDHTPSTQQDILLTDKSKPTLFKDDDLVIVTPEAVRGLVEVKTRIGALAKLQTIVDKLADSVSHVRKSVQQQLYSAGLFVYQDQGLLREHILHALQAATNGDENRIIDFVAFGPHTLTWFDRVSSEWKLYHLESLAHSYFVSHMVWRMASGSPEHMKYAWFPLQRERARYGVYRMSFSDGYVRPFEG